MKTQDEVNEAIRVAVQENGYEELLKLTPEGAAVDLITYNSEYEDEDLPVLTPLVRKAQAHWRERWTILYSKSPTEIDVEPRRED